MSHRLSQEEFIQRVKGIYNDEFEVIDNYIDSKTKIRFKHKKCGTVIERIPNNVLTHKNMSCPVCNGCSAMKAVKGVTDLWTLRPDVAKLLENPEEGYEYTVHSSKKANFICPCCNNVLYKPILKVTDSGLSCSYCGKTKSYPNKFMCNLLKALCVEFETEYKISGYDYRYDFYFVLNNNSYAIEMDGGLGHGNKTYEGKEDKIGLKTDYIKDKICKENNINIIRIDCNYKHKNRFKYILKNVKDSELSKIFDLSKVDFDVIDITSSISTLNSVVDLWNNGIRSYDEFYEQLHIPRQTVRRYLQEASNKNIISDTYDEILKSIRKASNKKLQKSKGKHILCVETNQVYISISEATKLTGISSIQRAVDNEHRYAGKLPDGTKLTWKSLTTNEYEKLVS